MIPYQGIASRMKEDRKAPGVSQGHYMRLSGKESDVEHSEVSDLLAGDLRSLYPVALFRVEN